MKPPSSAALSRPNLAILAIEKIAISARVTVMTTADAAAVLDGSVRYGPGRRAHEQI